MSENSSYLPIAVAFAAGIAVGAVVSSGDKPAPVERATAVATDAAETVVEESAAAVDAAAEEGATMVETAEEMAADAGEAVADAADAAVEAAGDAYDAVAAEAAEIAESIGAVEAVEDVSDDVRERVNVLAQQMAGIVAMIQDLQAGGGAPAPDAAPAETPAAAPAEAPAASSAADALAAEIGDTGLALAVGEIGEVEEVRVFMSRIDAEATAARVMIVGVGPQMIAAGDAPLDLGNGCTVSLAGVADGKAYLKVVCAS